ncbi:hypothetical protein KO507_18660 [Gilvimarinus agarilyticus]|uniref:hypothetical protein n=1 Tax=unclassified Gilvimarinus TaxID=2642066 RepID=UPI001C08B961|nr:MULTISPECIES: hypothetical protein [unclassified Gilvimarinus]MBU2887792.1 hypothetical protein [Gilvimarinus agarilyticus]MDO6572431.1 hypothetical protein [Gilvimarinus sp. 2_MG-2023]MDO6746575.1 hypothetical protein [Gilvimarinus sp. 1_MG-2023]
MTLERIVSIFLLAILASACSQVYYDPGYSKDGLREGYEPDLEACQEAFADSATQRDACMAEKGWTRSDAIKVEREPDSAID